MAVGAGQDLDLTASEGEAWRAATRSLLQRENDALAQAFDAGASAATLLARRCKLVDQVVTGAWRSIAGAPAGLDLLATGGYGRGELYPHSDVDVLILGDTRDQDAAQSSIQAFLAALWDVGLQPGHAARSIHQCVAESAADLTVMTSLLDARQLVGEARTLEALGAALEADATWQPAAFFRGKLDELQQRHARYNDTAYNLEPNLKEGPGGLRDLHTLGWMARRLFRASSLDALRPLGLLGEDEAETLAREYESIARLRIGLHLVAGRREERLLFEHQTALAKRLGLRDQHQENLAVEQLMQSYFRSAALVLRLSDRLLQRFDESLAGPQAAQPIDDDFEHVGGYLKLRRVEALDEDPSLLMRVFLSWQDHPELVGLHSSTARAIGEMLDRIDEGYRARPEVRAAFMRLVRHESAADILARMAHLGVLGRYLPAFGRVSGRMQYDLFHVYTVDQHTLAVLRNIASFRLESSRQRFSLAFEVWPRLRKPALLLLAGLFHDIAKGRGGDHSVLGEEDARSFCADHGISAADTDLIAWLVRHHLTMSVTAQRQDIADPEVIARFAEFVSERERLDYLYLLTVADIAGTSPKLWNAWKDRLLADLYGSTRFALRRGVRHIVHGEERIAEAREEAHAVLLAHGISEAKIAEIWAEFPDESFLRYRPAQIAWQTIGIAQADPDKPLVLVRPHARPGALEVFVYSRDRDGLFAAVTATLDRLGLNVVEARVVTSTRGMSLDTFQVLDAGSEFVSPERRAATVTESLSEALSQSLLSVSAARRAIPRQLKHFQVPIRVAFNETQPGRTELSLVCADRPGLLAQVSAVFRDAGLRVHDARIATFGERVEDFFQLSDEHDQPLDEAARNTLQEALRAAVDNERKTR